MPLPKVVISMPPALLEQRAQALHASSKCSRTRFRVLRAQRSLGDDSRTGANLMASDEDSPGFSRARLRAVLHHL